MKYLTKVRYTAAQNGDTAFEKALFAYAACAQTHPAACRQIAESLCLHDLSLIHILSPARRCRRRSPAISRCCLTPIPALSEEQCRMTGSTTKGKLKKAAIGVAVTVFWLAVWQGLCLLVGQEQMCIRDRCC